MSEGIVCVVGLGNPGARYEDTRHNVGFWFVERLARRHGAVLREESRFSGEVAGIRTEAGTCWLLRPLTWMNHSGRSVSALARYYRIPPERLLVVHDELDLPPGTLRLKRGGGHGGHNGLRDIIAALGSRDFWRARVGIGHPGHREAVTGHVLSRPGRDEQQAIEQALDVLERHWTEVQAGDFQAAMQAIHSAT